MALAALEAMWMELLVVCLDVLSLDASIAVRAQRMIELVVVPVAIWIVAQNIEVHGGKRLFTRLASETLLVPASCQPAIGGAHGFTDDHVTTTSTFAFMIGSSSSKWSF